MRHGFHGYSSSGNVLHGDGTFTAHGPTGALALVAVCGFYDYAGETFYPQFIGVIPNLHLYGGVVLEADITADLPLVEPATIAVRESPLHAAGPHYYEHEVFLDFGGDGVFSMGAWVIEGADEVLSGGRFPSLDGLPERSTFSVYSRARSATDAQIGSSTWVENLPSVELVRPPPFVAAPAILTPGDHEKLVGRYVEWQHTNSTPPDYWHLTVHDAETLDQVWEVLTPGDTRSLTLTGLSGELDFDEGLYRAELVGVRVPGFDFNDFSYDTLRYEYWTGFSWAGTSFYYPGVD